MEEEQVEGTGETTEEEDDYENKYVVHGLVPPPPQRHVEAKVVCTEEVGATAPNAAREPKLCYVCPKLEDVEQELEIEPSELTDEEVDTFQHPYAPQGRPLAFYCGKDPHATQMLLLKMCYPEQFANLQIRHERMGTPSECYARGKKDGARGRWFAQQRRRRRAAAAAAEEEEEEEEEEPQAEEEEEEPQAEEEEEEPQAEEKEEEDQNPLLPQNSNQSDEEPEPPASEEEEEEDRRRERPRRSLSPIGRTRTRQRDRLPIAARLRSKSQVGTVPPLPPLRRRRPPHAPAPLPALPPPPPLVVVPPALPAPIPPVFVPAPIVLPPPPAPVRRPRRRLVNETIAGRQNSFPIASRRHGRSRQQEELRRQHRSRKIYS